MSDERPQDAFTPESLGEDFEESARSQLAQVELSLAASRSDSETAGLVDEVYRAAHSLGAAVQPDRSPNLLRLARRLQEVARGVRSGRIAATRDLGLALASIARIGREGMDARAAEPMSVAWAAAALEELLEHPGSWSAPPILSRRAVAWAKVEADRLAAAGEAARASRAAFIAYARASEESRAATTRFQALLDSYHRALGILRERIPQAMASAARGEPSSPAAAQVAEAVSSLEASAESLGRSLSQTAAAVAEAATASSRSADQAETAFASLTSVRLDALLEDLPRMVRRLARKAGTQFELAVPPTDLEVLASRSEGVAYLVRRCVTAAVESISRGPGGAGGRRRRRTGKAEAPVPTVTIHARASHDALYLSLTAAGAAADREVLERARSSLGGRLRREGAALEMEVRGRQGAFIMLTVRSAAAAISRRGDFLFARAGSTWYALPASSVVECIDGDLSMTGYTLEGERLATLRMNDTQEPRKAVVVKTPRGGCVLLFDAVGSSEAGVQTTGAGDGVRIAGIAGSVRRQDGSVARLLDLGVLLPGAG